MFTIDFINIFLALWLKPMIVLMIMLSIIKNTFTFSAAARHSLITSSVIATSIGATAVFWLPNIPLTMVPQHFAHYSEFVVSTSNLFTSSVYLLITVYLLVAFWIVFYQLHGFFEVRSMTCHSVPVEDPNVDKYLNQMRGSYRIKKSISVFETHQVNSPIVWGHMSPAVLLPYAYREWSDRRLQRVLAHELAHIARNDWILKITLKFVCAALWAVPLIWYAAREIEWFAELSCDDRVIDTLGRPAEYGEDLLAMSIQQTPSSWVLSLVKSSNIFRRIERILDGRYQRDTLESKTKVLNMFVCSIVIFPVSLIYAIPESEENTYSTIESDLRLDLKLPETGPVQKHNNESYYFDPKKFKTLVQILPDSPKFTEEVVVVNNDFKNDFKTLPHDTNNALEKPVFKRLPHPYTEVKGALPQVLATPIYPENAMKKGIEGQVIVQFTVDIDGKIVEPRIVLSQPNKVFDRAVLRALARSKFLPMEIGGQPIKTINMTQNYVFKLYQSTTDKSAVQRLKYTRFAEL